MNVSPASASPTEPTGAAPVIGCEPGSFGWSVLHERHPALIAKVRAGQPFGPAGQAALSRLEREVTEGVVITPEPRVPGDPWQTWATEYRGRRLDEAPFLWAENYFYRRLLDATGYYRPGPWQGVDPFAPMKTAELASGDFLPGLAWYEDLAGAPAAAQDAALVSASLWGNRADLGFQMSVALAADGPDAGGAAAGPGGRGGPGDGDGAPALLADHSGVMWSVLAAARSSRVVVVADNTGRELVPDLLLIDHLLVTGRAAEISVHVKPAPYFVSDATTADLADCLRWLAAQAGRLGEAGRRLWLAATTGRLAIETHSFYCCPRTYHDLPGDLAARFRAAALTIMKGDLNYRRLVGDRHWPATTSFGDLTAYFPGPVTAFRTIKSELAIGLDTATLASLDQADPAWRVSGRHAVIHTALKSLLAL